VRLNKFIQNVVLIGCLLHATAYAEIYKWRDAKGVMNYSDTPPPAGKQDTQQIKATKVTNEYPLTRSDAYKEDVPAAKEVTKAQHGGKSTEPEPGSPEAQAKALEARVKAQNCASARSNYRNYAIGGRMQNVNENGEKEYLTDEQIKEGQIRAQQEIDENCPVE
jgi:hypothetical protein